MKKVGAWRWLRAAAGLGLVVSAAGLGGCGDDEVVGGAAGQGGTGGSGGTSGAAGAAGTGGASGAGPSLDPAACTFEVPPTRAARPAPTPGAVKAGVGEARLDLPMGTPLGGYGGRVMGLGGKPVDARPARVNTGLIPSLGTHDSPTVSAVALDVGGERLVIARVDSIYMIDNLVFAVEKALAPDGSMRGKVVLAGTHSHASYGGWQGSYVLMPGGNDRSRQDMFDRVVASVTAAASQALGSLEPARIGVGVTATFDPENLVSHDRRGENDNLLGPDGNTAGKSKDGQAWALRVDRADGSPLVALVDFPVHGTVTEAENLFASTDVPGAIERATSARLGYRVIHLQGAAGDVSPTYEESRSRCVDGFHCFDTPALERIGAQAALAVEPLVAGIQTGGTAALEVVTRSFRTGRNVPVQRPGGGKLLSYAPPLTDEDEDEPDYKLLEADGSVAVPIDEFNAVEGAGLCGDPKAGSFAKIPGDVSKLGPYRSCLDVESGLELIYGLFYLKTAQAPLPLCETRRVTTTAIRLTGTPSGDYLISTLPGEPTAPIAAYLRNRSPAGPDRTLVLGYAQDHIGYILTAEDWLQGGYEPSINVWGPIEGEQTVDAALESAAIAWTPELEDPEVGSSRFTDFSYAPPYAAITVTTTTDHGTALKTAPEGILWPDVLTAELTSASASVPRATGVARFVFRGGDPIVDAPVVTVEHEISPGTFEPLVDERQNAASSLRGDVILSYAPSPLADKNPTAHAYAASWQPVPPGPFSLTDPARPFSLPTGNYRLHARGRAQAASGLTDYDVVSPTFALVPAPLAATSTAALTGSSLAVQASLGDAPGLRALVAKGSCDQNIPLVGPWTLTVTPSSGSPVVFKDVAPTDGKASVTLDASITAITSVEVRDANGNGGVITP